MSLPAQAPTVETPKAPPAFALAGELADRLKRDKLSGGEREDRDAATKFYAAREGEPIWTTANGLTDRALALITELRAADSYGLQANAFKTPDKVDATKRESLADAEVTLSLAALKYARHARGGRTDPAAISKNFDRKPQPYSASSLLAEFAAAADPADYVRRLHPSHPQFERLRLKYLAVKAGQTVLDAPPAQPPAAPGKKAAVAPAAPSPAAIEKKLLANMEMWRWMPNFGDYYIQNNVPEFMTRMVRGGKVVHAERIVTGKADTQTPIFSDEMSIVVFKPFWNVPESIKWKELQPQLSRHPSALAKAGLKAAYNGKEVDPADVDWRSADMRAFHIFQPPGATNALGQVKFLFPNKHDVYMHDTPQKPLFNNAARAYSHGCMRVRDPLKFAELLLAHDKGWDMARVQQLANTGPDNNEIRLTKKVPIHVTYFTAWVEDDGKLKTFKDVYGHEPNIQLGLEGKTHLIVQPKEEKYVPPERGQVRFVQRQQKSEDPVGNWIKNLFSF